MADLKISALTASTTPLAGTEVLPIVQSSTTKQVSVANLTAGRAVNAASLQTTGNIGANVFSTWGLSASNYRAVEVGSAGNALFCGPNDTNFVSNAVYNGGWKYGTASYASQYSQTNGNHTFATAPLGAAIGDPITFTDRFSVARTGDVTVSTGNLVIGTSGKGIDFSATPGTGTSELLADYEEGTWTPTVSSGIGTITTLGTVTGKYTKIGNIVTLFTVINITINGTGAGWILVGGLPFSANTSTSAYSGYGRDRAISGKQLQVDFVSTGSTYEIVNYDNTYPGASGALLIVTVVYAAA